MVLVILEKIIYKIKYFLKHNTLFGQKKNMNSANVDKKKKKKRSI